jgi:DNA-binding Lrp family transcriptional regulator
MRRGCVMEAFVLVKIATQREVYGFNRSVAEKLGSMEGVESTELLFGDYDAIVKLRVPKIHDCENLVIEEISTIDGVQSTVTLLCIDEKILE